MSGSSDSHPSFNWGPRRKTKLAREGINHHPDLVETRPAQVGKQAASQLPGVRKFV